MLYLSISSAIDSSQSTLCEGINLYVAYTLVPRVVIIDSWLWHNIDTYF